MPKYTAYAKITVPYLMDIDARNVDEAAKIADEQLFEKWSINQEEISYLDQDDYQIDIIAVQPGRTINES
tara:strand:+ start:50 stop:259 length:210 start_codon:yes stop_codon:yes gene_type:complete